MKKLSPRAHIILSMLIFGTIGVFRRAIPYPSSLVALVRAVMTNLDMWGQDLTRVPGFEDEVVRILKLIREKGALEAYAAALRRGAPVRPECLGTLVDCLVFNYRLRHGLGWSASPAGGAHRGVSAGGLLSCLGCRGFLSEPVTVPCGHSYCRRCLRREEH